MPILPKIQLVQTFYPCQDLCRTLLELEHKVNMRHHRKCIPWFLRDKTEFCRTSPSWPFAELTGQQANMAKAGLHFRAFSSDSSIFGCGHINLKCSWIPMKFSWFFHVQIAVQPVSTWIFQSVNIYICIYTYIYIYFTVSLLRESHRPFWLSPWTWIMQQLTCSWTRPDIEQNASMSQLSGTLHADSGETLWNMVKLFMVCFGRKALSFDLDKMTSAWIWPPRSTLYLHRNRVHGKSQEMGSETGSIEAMYELDTAKTHVKKLEDLEGCIPAFPALGLLWLWHLIAIQTAHHNVSLYSPICHLWHTCANEFSPTTCLWACWPLTALDLDSTLLPDLLPKRSGLAPALWACWKRARNQKPNRLPNCTEIDLPKSSSKDVENCMDCHRLQISKYL